MADEIISGIYVIHNTISNKLYVGSSVNTKKRWREHRCSLRKGNHPAPLLQRAWNFRGADAFLFEVIEKVENKNQLAAREQYWIDTLRSFGNRGYNASAVAYRFREEDQRKGVEASAQLRRGKPQSAESNLRRSLSQKGIPKGHGHKISATKKALGQKPSLEAARLGGIATCKIRWEK